MPDPAAATTERIELWGGVECTVNRVGDRYHDQLHLTGHADRFDDIARIVALGVRRVRYPVLWERVAPSQPDDLDWRWSDERLHALRSAGVAPIAGLVHHGSGPSYATLLDPHFPEALAAYAGAVARRYPWIDAYTPVNEPMTTARFAALYGHWFPHQRTDAAFVRSLLNECRGIALAMAAIRDVNAAAMLVQTDDAGRTHATAPLAYQADFENERRWLAWDLLMGRVTVRHPLWSYLRRSGASTRELAWFVDHPCRVDVVGLNYYVTSDRFLDHRTGRYPAMAVAGNGRDRYVDVEAVRGLGHIAGHRQILQEAWERWGRPVAITEAHLGCTREEQCRWLLAAWDGADQARQSGVPVVAVTAWALFGLCDWDSLVTRVAGRYEPGAYDVRGPQPRPTALAPLIASLAEGRPLRDPAARGRGWWQTPQAIDIAPVTPVRRRSLLITGAGTLGRALAHACEERGIDHVLLGHRELDIADRFAVAAAVRRHRPWAVVNAAGYVSVDDAEADEASCRRSNVAGAAVLARMCARQQIRFVTFSSDLVFGGESDRPYVETDSPRPLGVYGRSKAEAERLVFEADPAALIIRTSAFFGGWNSPNVLCRALTVLERGGYWRAATDIRMSATYVPDLARATLDLLLDRESGIWHLANEGDVSWADLVREGARICGVNTERLVDCAARELGWVAPRPMYTVLGSERGLLMPPLGDALERFARDRKAI